MRILYAIAVASAFAPAGKPTADSVRHWLSAPTTAGAAHSDLSQPLQLSAAGLRDYKANQPIAASFAAMPLFASDETAKVPAPDEAASSGLRAAVASWQRMAHARRQVDVLLALEQGTVLDARIEGLTKLIGEPQPTPAPSRSTEFLSVVRSLRHFWQAQKQSQEFADQARSAFDTQKFTECRRLCQEHSRLVKQLSPEDQVGFPATNDPVLQELGQRAGLRAAYAALPDKTGAAARVSALKTFLEDYGKTAAETLGAEEVAMLDKARKELPVLEREQAVRAFRADPGDTPVECLKRLAKLLQAFPSRETRLEVRPDTAKWMAKWMTAKPVPLKAEYEEAITSNGDLVIGVFEPIQGKTDQFRLYKSPDDRDAMRDSERVSDRDFKLKKRTPLFVVAVTDYNRYRLGLLKQHQTRADWNSFNTRLEELEQKLKFYETPKLIFGDKPPNISFQDARTVAETVLSHWQTWEQLFADE